MSAVTVGPTRRAAAAGGDVLRFQGRRDGVLSRAARACFFLGSNAQSSQDVKGFFYSKENSLNEVELRPLLLRERPTGSQAWSRFSLATRRLTVPSSRPRRAPPLARPVDPHHASTRVCWMKMDSCFVCHHVISPHTSPSVVASCRCVCRPSSPCSVCRCDHSSSEGL